MEKQSDQSSACIRPKQLSTSDSKQCAVCGVQFRSGAALGSHIAMHRKAESLPICSQSYRHFDYDESDPSLTPTTRPRSQSGVDRTNDEDSTLGSLALEQTGPALASISVQSFSGHLRVPSTSSDTLPSARPTTVIASLRTANEFPQEAQFQCNECGRRFSLLCRLRSHYLESHVQLKPFRCTTPGCSAAFANASRLKRHTASHTASRNFICDVCGKGFVRNDHLRVHMEQHENAKRESASASRHTAASAGKRLSGLIHIEELIEHLEAARASRSPRRCRKRRRICRFKRSHSDYEASASSSCSASSVSSRASSRSRSLSSSARSASPASSNDSDNDNDNDNEAVAGSETTSVAQSTHSFPQTSASLAAAAHQNTRYSFSSFEQSVRAAPFTSSSRAHKRSTNSDRHHSPRRRSSRRHSHCEHCSSKIKSSRKECSCSHCPVHQRHHSSRHSQHNHSSSAAPAHEFQPPPPPPPPQRPHPPAFNRLSSPTFVTRDDVSAFSQQGAMHLNLVPSANRFQNSVVDCLTLAGTSYPTSAQIECGALHRNQQQGASMELVTTHAPSGISPLGLLPAAQPPAAAALVPFSNASSIEAALVPFANSSLEAALGPFSNAPSTDAALVTPQAPLETIRVLFQCPADDCSQRFDSQGALREHFLKHLSGELPSQLFCLLPSPAAAGGFSSSPPQQQQHALGFRAAPPPQPHPTPAQPAQQPNGRFFVPEAAITPSHANANGATGFNFVNATRSPSANAPPPPPSDASVFSETMNPLLGDESLVFGQFGLSESDQSSLLNALNLMAPYNDVGPGPLFAPIESLAPPVSEYMTFTPLQPGLALHASFTSAALPANGAMAANGAVSRSTLMPTPMLLTPNVSALTLPNVGHARSRVPTKRLMSPPAPYVLFQQAYVQPGSCARTDNYCNQLMASRCKWRRHQLRHRTAAIDESFSIGIQPPQAISSHPTEAAPAGMQIQPPYILPLIPSAMSSFSVNGDRTKRHANPSAPVAVPVVANPVCAPKPPQGQAQTHSPPRTYTPPHSRQFVRTASSSAALTALSLSGPASVPPVPVHPLSPPALATHHSLDLFSTQPDLLSAPPAMSCGVLDAMALEVALADFSNPVLDDAALCSQTAATASRVANMNLLSSCGLQDVINVDT